MEIKRISKIIICLAVALLMTLSVFSCGKDGLMSLDGSKLSMEIYKLMLSVQKGNMAYLINYSYGNYNSDEFWDTVIDERSTTNDEYYTYAIYSRAKNLLSASVMFDKKGLKLSDQKIADIDKEMDNFIKEFGGGDKKAFNTVLKTYGFDFDTLKEYKILTAKAEELSRSLYGSNGSKIGAGLKDEYFKENYVCFKQILISSYYLLYETDENCDVIYYDGLGGIAYDTENAEAVMDDNGKLVYYKEDGRISYDTENGKPSPVLDENGYQEIADYSREELILRAERAAELAELSESQEIFDSLARLYSDNEASVGKRIYLATNVNYGSISKSYEFFDNVSKELSQMEIGETAVYSDNLGFHVIIRCDLESGAYDNKDYSLWFNDSYGVFDFSDNLQNELFDKVLKDYGEKITVDKEMLNSFTLRDAVPNYYYH